jgi:hypothetical protein
MVQNVEHISVLENQFSDSSVVVLVVLVVLG